MRHRALLKEKILALFFSNEDPQKSDFLILIKALIPLILTNGKTSSLLIK